MINIDLPLAIATALGIMVTLWKFASSVSQFSQAVSDLQQAVTESKQAR